MEGRNYRLLNKLPEGIQPTHYKRLKYKELSIPALKDETRDKKHVVYLEENIQKNPKQSPFFEVKMQEEKTNLNRIHLDPNQLKASQAKIIQNPVLYLVAEDGGPIDSEDFELFLRNSEDLKYTIGTYIRNMKSFNIDERSSYYAKTQQPSYSPLVVAPREQQQEKSHGGVSYCAMSEGDEDTTPLQKAMFILDRALALQKASNASVIGVPLEVDENLAVQIRRAYQVDHQWKTGIKADQSPIAHQIEHLLETVDLYKPLKSHIKFLPITVDGKREYKPAWAENDLFEIEDFNAEEGAALLCPQNGTRYGIPSSFQNKQPENIKKLIQGTMESFSEYVLREESEDETLVLEAKKVPEAKKDKPIIIPKIRENQLNRRDTVQPNIEAIEDAVAKTAKTEIEEIYTPFISEYIKRLDRYIEDHATTTKTWEVQIKETLSPGNYAERRTVATQLRGQLAKIRDNLDNIGNLHDEIQKVSQSAMVERNTTLRGTHSELINIIGSMEYQLTQLAEKERKKIADVPFISEKEEEDRLFKILKTQFQRMFALDSASKNISMNRLLNIKADTREEWLQIIQAEYKNIRNSGSLHTKLSGFLERARAHKVPVAIHSNLRHFFQPTVDALLKYINDREYNMAVERDALSHGSLRARLDKAGEIAHALLTCKTRDQLKKIIADAALFKDMLKTEGVKNSKLITIINQLQEREITFLSSHPLPNAEVIQRNVNELLDNYPDAKRKSDLAFKSDKSKKSKVSGKSKESQVSVIYEKKPAAAFQAYFDEIKRAISINASDEVKRASIDQLVNGFKIGGRLGNQLKAHVDKIHTMPLSTFIGLMMKCTEPHISTEESENIPFPGKKLKVPISETWTQKEAQLLGTIVRKIKDVTVYTYKTFYYNGPTDEDIIPPEKRPTCDVYSMDGAILGDLKDGHNPIDIELVTDDVLVQIEGTNRWKRRFNEAKYKEFLRDRIVSFLIDANESHPDGTIVTMPVLGGGAYAGNYKIEVNACFSRIFQELVTEYAHLLPNIKAVVHTRGVDEDKANLPDTHKNLGNIPYIETSKNIGFCPKEHPEIFEHLDSLTQDALQACAVSAVDAGDRLACIGNDALTRLVKTLDGAFGGYTTVIPQGTGIEAQFCKVDGKWRFWPKANLYLMETTADVNVNAAGTLKLSVGNDIYLYQSGDDLVYATKIVTKAGNEINKINYLSRADKELVAMIKAKEAFDQPYDNPAKCTNPEINRAAENLPLSQTFGAVCRAKGEEGKLIIGEVITIALPATRVEQVITCAKELAKSQSKNQNRRANGHQFIEQVSPGIVEQVRQEYPALFYAQLCLSRLEDLEEKERHAGTVRELKRDLNDFITKIRMTGVDYSTDTLRKLLTMYFDQIRWSDKSKGFLSSKTSELGFFLNHFIAREIPSELIPSKIPKLDEYDTNTTADEIYLNPVKFLFPAIDYFKITKDKEITMFNLMDNPPVSELINKFLFDFITNKEESIQNYSLNTLSILKLLKEVVPDKMGTINVKAQLNHLYKHALYLRENNYEIDSENELSDKEKTNLFSRGITDPYKRSLFVLQSRYDTLKLKFNNYDKEVKGLNNQTAEKNIGSVGYVQAAKTYINESLISFNNLQNNIETDSSKLVLIQILRRAQVFSRFKNGEWNENPNINTEDLDTISSHLEKFNRLPDEFKLTNPDLDGDNLRAYGFSEDEINSLTPFQRLMYDTIALDLRRRIDLHLISASGKTNPVRNAAATRLFKRDVLPIFKEKLASSINESIAKNINHFNQTLTTLSKQHQSLARFIKSDFSDAPEVDGLLQKFLNDFDNKNEIAIRGYSIDALAILKYLRSVIPEQMEGEKVKEKLDQLYYQAIYLKRTDSNYKPAFFDALNTKVTALSQGVDAILLSPQKKSSAIQVQDEASKTMTLKTLAGDSTTLTDDLERKMINLGIKQDAESITETLLSSEPSIVETIEKSRFITPSYKVNLLTLTADDLNLVQAIENVNMVKQSSSPYLVRQTKEPEEYYLYCRNSERNWELIELSQQDVPQSLLQKGDFSGDGKFSHELLGIDKEQTSSETIRDIQRSIMIGADEHANISYHFDLDATSKMLTSCGFQPNDLLGLTPYDHLVYASVAKATIESLIDKYAIQEMDEASKAAIIQQVKEALLPAMNNRKARYAPESTRDSRSIGILTESSLGTFSHPSSPETSPVNTPRDRELLGTAQPGMRQNSGSKNSK